MRSDLPPQTALDRFGRYEWTISVVEIDRGWVQRVAFVQRKPLISTILQVVCGGFFAAVMMLGRRWYMYVAHAGRPYDAVDIALTGCRHPGVPGWRDVIGARPFEYSVEIRAPRQNRRIAF